MSDEDRDKKEFYFFMDELKGELKDIQKEALKDINDYDADCYSSDIWDKYDLSDENIDSEEAENFMTELVTGIARSGVFFAILDNEGIFRNGMNNVKLECKVAKKLNKPFIIAKLSSIRIPEEFYIEFLPTEFEHILIVDADTIEGLVSPATGLATRIARIIVDVGRGLMEMPDPYSVSDADYLKMISDALGDPPYNDS